MVIGQYKVLAQLKYLDANYSMMQNPCSSSHCFCHCDCHGTISSKHSLCLTVDFSCDNTVRIHVTCLHEGGFYSLVIKPGLRLVSLNTNLYYSPNEVTVNMSDPAGQFQWLQETLELSRQNMEKVSLFCLLSTRHFNFRKSLLH